MQNVFTIISNLAAVNKDGAYVDQQAAQPNLPTGPASDLVVFVGSGSRGKTNMLLTASDPGSAALAIGESTLLNKSALREALSSMPECTNVGFVRVTDGTDVEAVIDALDSQETPGVVLIGTAVASGADLNAATVRIDLQSGTPTSGPIYTLTRFSPGRNALVWQNIVGSATPTGAYSAAVFQTNALAALNGTAPNTIADPDFVWTAGSSTFAPATATPFQASGGTNGDSGVTDAICIGEDAGVSSTGIYVLRKQIAGAQVVIADFSTAADFATVAAFAFSEGAFGWETFPAGTETSSAVSTKAANNMSSDNMGVAIDWDEVFDTFQAKQLLVSPIGKLAGVVSSLNPWQYPGNNPPNGVQGVTTTERLQLGAIDDTEMAQRQANGILYLGVTPNGVLGLPHGLTSSGVQINVVRMRNYIAWGVGQIMGRYVGAMLETSLPLAQADENDPRIQCQSALNAWFGTMTQPGNKQISAFLVTISDTNNTPVTMGDGYLIATIAVTTLTGVQFALAFVQVGNTVQIQTTPLPSAA